MITLLLAFFMVFAIAFVLSLLTLLNEVANWISDAEIEIDEKEEMASLDLDNAEYDWGHNIRSDYE